MQGLKKARRSAGLTQRELAEKVGASASTVYKWEAGLALPSVPTVRHLAEVLNVSLENLVQPPNPQDPPDS